MTQQQQTLEQQLQRLQERQQRLESPDRLRQAAHRLGMVPEGDPSFLRLHDGHFVGKVTPPAADAAVSGR
jgi:hypothetical protein